MLLCRIKLDAMPLSKLAPEELCITVFFFFSKIVEISFDVVVFPLVPATIMVLIPEFCMISFIKNLLNFNAICPGQVDPSPKFRLLVVYEISFPEKIKMELSMI